MIGAAGRCRSSGGLERRPAVAAPARRALVLRAAALLLGGLLALRAPHARAQGYYGYGYGYGFGTTESNQVYQPFRWELSAGGNLTQGAASQYLDNGWTLDGGVTWFPARQSRFGLRLDASYSHFDATNQFIFRSAQQANSEIDGGFGRIWGGDADVVFDTPLGAHADGYLLGGVGLYWRQIALTQTVIAPGFFCDPWWGFCGVGYAPFDAVVSNQSTGTHFAWNVGAGVEFPISPTTSVFIEMRYLRISPADQRTELVPITIGMRF